MIRVIEAKSYEKWLKELDVLSLNKRKPRIDMITVSQYMKGRHRAEYVHMNVFPLTS